MPRDISPSSSEDEGDSPAITEQPIETNTKKTSLYQCPADFVPFSHKPCSSTLTKSLKDKNKELWLIKAPASFDPECFRGVQVPLSGFKTLKVPSATAGAKSESGQHIYNILGSTHGTVDLCLLTSDKESSSKVVLGPKFSGLLNVCESFGGSSSNQAPLVIPAAPAPSIPPGLKQRFYPFGSKTPTLNSVVEERSREKKKKKKEKRMKVEQDNVMYGVKVEPVEALEGAVAELQPQEFAVVEETTKKKKKKKKRDREQQEEEEQQQQGSEPSMKTELEVAVKLEPMDSQYDDVVEGCGQKKKKKKKKKSKTDDD